MKIKSDHISLGVAIISSFICLFAWQYPMKPTNVESSATLAQPSTAYTPAELTISAVGTHVQIKRKISREPYDGGSINGTGSKAVIHLPPGQPLNVTITGTGVKLDIDRSIIEYVNISDFGVGNKVN